MKPETEIDETGSFGEPEEKPAPFWKRSVWGISVATWGLCAVVLLAAIWYLFLRAPSETGMPPFNDADAGVQTWQTTQESSPSVQSTETMTVRTGDDMSQLARDVKTELDNRDEKIQATLNMLHDSINKLGEAIKKDEEYAQETRRQLDDIRSRLNGIMTQKSVTESSSTPHPAKKKTSSVLNGMKIMSMETGMAWIRWQGSTWAVREGQTLGNVVIQRIDPTTRTIITSAGTLR
ncbi:IncI1-type conjugal transfer protein TraP [Salmonella enterica]|nr:IncI1-type conjugal transfer protein TraP [Salmonella enterica]